MLSNIPFDLSKLSGEDLEKQILRVGLTAEMDAINLYEQLASISQDESVKKALLNIAREEKEHVGEFETLLLRKDTEQIKELEEGTQEIEKIDQQKG